MPKKVVSNTTPLLSLLKIDKLWLLNELYQQISIPQAVFQEIENGKSKPYYKDLTKNTWINIEVISGHETSKHLSDLGAGEYETLILAQERKADLVIMDERMGRNYAKQLGFKLTGTIGILLKAKQNHLLPSIKEVMEELTKKGTWLNPKLIHRTLELAGEK